MSAASDKKQEQLAKQIAEVRRFMLDKTTGRYYGRDLDGRIGLALFKQGIAKNDARYSSERPQYELATHQGKLVDAARAFCDANGLKELADAFDHYSITRYVDSKTIPLQQQRRRVADEMAELQKRLDGIDARIAEFTILLPIGEAADHEGDATEATGHYDEPTPPTASEY